MNTAPCWPLLLPGPCCSGNTGFGSRPFIRYVIGAEGVGVDAPLPPGPYSVWLQAGMADIGANVAPSPVTPKADITNQSLLSSPPDQLGSHY